MYDTDKEKIEAVTHAIDALYNRIDACIDRDDGFVARCAELNTNYNNAAAMDMIMSDSCEAGEFVMDELVEEIVNFVQALYWARERGEELAYPMRSRTEPHPAQKEYFTELNKAIKEAPEKARIRKLTKEIDELPNFLNNEFAKGFNKCTE